MADKAAVTVTKARALEIPAIFALYRTAFPRAERKPFSVIRKMAKRGRADIWTIRHDGRFAGLAATVNGQENILLDYFAVKSALRGRGHIFLFFSITDCYKILNIIPCAIQTILVYIF